MATAKSLNIRRADAVERMAQALTLIESIAGVAPVDINPRHKNEDIRSTLQLEAFADTLDSIAMAVGEMVKPPVAPPPAETVAQAPTKAKRK